MRSGKEEWEWECMQDMSRRCVGMRYVEEVCRYEVCGEGVEEQGGEQGRAQGRAGARRQRHRRSSPHTPAPTVRPLYTLYFILYTLYYTPAPTVRPLCSTLLSRARPLLPLASHLRRASNQV